MSCSAHLIISCHALRLSLSLHIKFGADLLIVIPLFEHVASVSYRLSFAEQGLKFGVVFGGLIFVEGEFVVGVAGENHVDLVFEIGFVQDTFWDSEAVSHVPSPCNYQESVLLFRVLCQKLPYFMRHSAVLDHLRWEHFRKLRTRLLRLIVHVTPRNHRFEEIVVLNNPLTCLIRSNMPIFLGLSQPFFQSFPHNHTSVSP